MECNMHERAKFNDCFRQAMQDDGGLREATKLARASRPKDRRKARRQTISRQSGELLDRRRRTLAAGEI
eukprot:7183389-Pyramimonas_sp.AAC.1